MSGTDQEDKGNEDYVDMLPQEDSPRPRRSRLEREESRQIKSFYNINSGSNWRDRFKDNRKKIAIITGITSIVTSLIFAAILALLPFELTHVKEAITDKYGGRQHFVLRTRAGKLYSRGFFFNDGKFDGYKNRGLFRVISNTNSKNLVEDMRSRGFNVEFAQDDAGRFTGRVSKFTAPDGSVVTEEDLGRDAGKQRKYIRQAFSDLYPERGFFWRGRKARALFSRLGISRDNWYRNNRLTRYLEGKEVAIKEKVKAKLKARQFGDPTGTTVTGGDRAPNKGETRITQDAGEFGEDINTKANQLRLFELRDLSDGASRLVDFDELAKEAGDSVDDAAEGAAKGAIIGFADYADKACEAKRYFKGVETGAKTLRAAQLAKHATFLLNMGDALKTGDVDRKELDEVMKILRGLKGEKSFTSSSSFSWVTGNKKARVGTNRADRYRVDGQMTGDLGKVNRLVNSVVPADACSVVSSPFAQIGSAIFTVGAGIFTGGGFSASQAAIGASVNVAFQFTKAVLEPVLVGLAAGTIISWDEKPTELMDGMVSGSGVLWSANGRDKGMQVLSNEQLAQLDKASDVDRNITDQHKGWAYRLFDKDNPQSVTFKIAAILPRSPTEFFSVITNLFQSSTSIPTKTANALLQRTPSDPVYAEGDALDPFYNPLVATPLDEVDAVDPLENAAWMLDNGQVDDNNNPVPESPYEDFVAKCFESVDVEQYNSPECKSKDYDKVQFRASRNYTAIAEGIVETINRDFDESQTSATTSISGVECPPNLGQTIQIGPTTYYQMPDPQGTTYSFDPGAPPAQRYGSKDLVCVLYTVAKAYDLKYPGKSHLDIGDLNASGHKSHKVGRDVDVNAVGEIGAADWEDSPRNYNTEATITLGKLFVDTGLVKLILWCDNDDGSTAVIADYAKSTGKQLDIHCESGHKDHFHVRTTTEPGATYGP